MTKNEQLRGLRRVASREPRRPPKHLDQRQVQHPNQHDQIVAGVNETPAHRPCDRVLARHRGGAAGAGFEAQNLIHRLADAGGLCAESCKLGRRLVAKQRLEGGSRQRPRSGAAFGDVSEEFLDASVELGVGQFLV